MCVGGHTPDTRADWEAGKGGFYPEKKREGESIKKCPDWLREHPQGERDS